MLILLVLADHRVVIKESKKIENTWMLPEKRKKVGPEDDCDTNCCWCTWNGSPWRRNWKSEEESRPQH